MSWPARVLTEPVTILAPPRGDDEYGPQAANWDQAEHIPATARLQPNTSTESLLNVDEQQGDWLGYFPPGTPITGRDRVQAGDAIFEVIGVPLRWTSPWTTTEHHVRALLRYVNRAGTDAAGERDGDFEEPPP